MVAARSNKNIIEKKYIQYIFYFHLYIRLRLFGIFSFMCPLSKNFPFILLLYNNNNNTEAC